MKKECKLGFVKCKINYDDVNVSVRIMWGIAFKTTKTAKLWNWANFSFSSTCIKPSIQSIFSWGYKVLNKPLQILYNFPKDA